MGKLLKWLGRTLGVIVLIVLAGGAGYLLRGFVAPVTLQSLGVSSDEEPATEAKVQIWTCSMHPQIQLPEPGLCPICSMQLIPMESGGEEIGLRRFATSAAGKALMDIQTSPVERRFVTAEIRMVGKVEYDETRIGYITAWVPGRLDRLYVDYTGVEVKKGDHMVYLYSPELLSAQEELLQALKAVEELSASDVSIMKETAQATVEAARDKLRLLGLAKEQIEEIEKRDEVTDHITIHAPMGGTVVHKNAQEGMYVKTGTRIYTIVDLSRVWVKLDAYESDLEWLRYGQKITFTAEAYPGDEFRGTIAFIDPVVDAKTRTTKVRVNVPNPEGKLKPGMFVHGVVRPKVGKGGRLVAPELAGHLPVVDNDAGKPLVIPVSAALVTGKRAIVYVEDAGADKPTFEGRQIVLGPRAGGYYIVRHGLEEGELVVTYGNFKIDSALQLQARPSMMTPEGGARATAHDHGAAAPTGKAPGEGMEMVVPEAFRHDLLQLEKAYEAVSDAVENEDLAKVREAFAALGEAIEGADAKDLSGHAAMVWKELAMLLGNDAFEGSEVTELREANRVFESLQRHMQRLQEQFGLEHVREGTPPVNHIEAPHQFREQLGKVWESYQAVHASLAADDADGALAAVRRAKGALASVEMKLLGHEAHMVWMKHLKELQSTIDRMDGADDMDGIREGFEGFSAALAEAIRTFRVAPAGPVYKLHCPMAFGGRGADWLQSDSQVRNPYSPTMLRCGGVVETITGEEARSAGEHEHE